VHGNHFSLRENSFCDVAVALIEDFECNGLISSVVVLTASLCRIIVP